MSIFNAAQQEELLAISDRLRAQADTRWGRLRLDGMLTRLIPWNTGHGFHLAHLSEGLGQITANNAHLNQNHVGGMHACALATLGEYCAGLTLLYSFSSAEYRLLLTKLEIEYFRQARGEVIATCRIEPELLQNTLDGASGSARVVLKTEIHERVADDSAAEGQLLCQSNTIWQLKRWDQAKS